MEKLTKENKYIKKFRETWIKLQDDFDDEYNLPEDFFERFLLKALKSQREDIIKIIKGVKTQVGADDPKTKEVANFIIDGLKSYLVNLIARKNEQDKV